MTGGPVLLYQSWKGWRPSSENIVRLLRSRVFSLESAQKFAYGPRTILLTSRRTQSPGLNSKVYVPIISRIFAEKYVPGAHEVDFTLDDVRRTAEVLGVRTRNPGDVIYRMRARTELPEEIRAKGFYILRQVGRGKYRMEKASGIIIDIDEDPVVLQALDLTPLPVRRLLPEHLYEVDEQGLLTIVNYSKIIDHFTGLTVYRLRNHVRKSVKGVGQAEVDEVDVGVAISDDEVPIIFPIEAKAVDDSINRVQICMQVRFARQYFNGHSIRPLAVKVDHKGLIHCLEFNDEINASDLQVMRRTVYQLQLSERQLALVRQPKAATT